MISEPAPSVRYNFIERGALSIFAVLWFIWPLVYGSDEQIEAICPGGRACGLARAMTGHEILGLNPVSLFLVITGLLTLIIAVNLLLRNTAIQTSNDKLVFNVFRFHEHLHVSQI